METAVQDPLVGRLVDGRYAVSARIARGGMATVYLATDTRLEREVALKVMHPHLADDEEFVARFHREAKSAARLSHPNVVAVYDQGAEGDVVYLAMELVAGQTLRDLMLAAAPLSPREALGVLDPVLDALAAAHRAGLVHRDVKPENVLLADDGRVKVADFGLARAATGSSSGATASVLIGTVAYLSPELVLRGVADARSDVYAAGILLFEMLTGRQPFSGEVPIQVAYQHVHDDVPPPSTVVDQLPRDLDDLVLWATARDPDDRPGDARELLSELREVRSTLPAADLDREPERLDDTAAVDGRTLVVGRREHALALPVGDPEDDLADDSADDSRATAAVRTTRDTAEQSWGYGPGGRRRRRGLFVLVGALVLAVLLGAGGWWFTAGPGAYTTTPTLAGKTLDEARTLLTAEGLAADVSERYDDEAPAGVVLGSDPAAGEQVRHGGTVDVFVSAGPESVPVPQLVGMSLDDAKAALADAGLTAGAVTEDFSEEIPQGAVISQSVPAEQPQKRSVPVDLVVSKGRQPIDVPSVVGKPRAEAEQAIRDVGLAVGGVTEAASESVPKGAVVAQEPKGGTLFRGEPVSIVVSSGPPLVAVPQVRGMQLEEAEKVLHDAGFETTVEKLFGGIFGTVHSTDPAEGTQIPKGSTVTIRVV